MAPKMKMTVGWEGTAIRVDVNDELIVLRTHQVDSLIQNLMLLRARMRPEAPAAFPASQPRVTHRVKSCHIGVDVGERTPILSLRSPGFGWLSLRIPIHALDEIVIRCRDVLARIPPTSRAVN